MKILVTGGAGFIGCHTAEYLLRRGDSVVVVDQLNDYYSLKQKNNNLRHLFSVASCSSGSYRFVKADIEDPEAMVELFKKEKFDIVCHLAARAGVRPSLENPLLYVQANVTGTTNLLECARLTGVSNFVYASSSSVYGKNKKVPFAESDPVLSPVSQYAATKRSCELMASAYSDIYGLNVTGLRFFTVYGPRGRPDMAPYKFFERICKGIPIERYGNGSSSRDYTYIDDIVQGVVAAIDKPHRCEVFNLGNSQVVTLNEFIQVIEEVAGRRAIVRELPNQPGDVPKTFADVSKAKEMLGYSPTTSIRDGMMKFAEWYLLSEDTDDDSGNSSDDCI